MKNSHLGCVSQPAKELANSDISFPCIVSSQLLLGNKGQLLIEHQGERYYLKLTKLNKLILTK